MRQSILRATRMMILSSIIVLGIPLFSTTLWLSSERHDLIDAWLARSTWERAVDLALVLLGLIVAGAVAAYLVARAEIARLMAPVGQITANAERLSRGESHIPPMECGIDEIDRISRVLSRAAYQQSRALAAERSFASDASHQLRTPLTALLMRIEEIADTDDLATAKEEATVAIAQVERLTAVVDDLLHRRRTEPQDALTDVPLDSVIAGLQREWQPAFETARRSVRVDGERGLVVRTTPVAVSEVLSTLLENSLVHGGGTVTITVRRSGPSVVVELRDEGTGVSGAVAPHIFERSVSGVSGGSGVGLAVARDLAEASGGRLDLLSRQPATFALFLSEAAHPGPRADARSANG